MVNWKRNLSIAWVTQVLSLSGFGFVVPFLPYFIQEIQPLTPEALRMWTGLIAAAPAITMGIMAPIWGAIADRFGRKLMLLRAMLFGSLIMIFMARAETIPMVLALRAAQGFFTGTVSASAALIASGTPEDRLSTALGFLASSNFVGFSLGPLIGGIAAEHFGYRTSFSIGSVMLLFGFILVFFFIEEPPGSGKRSATGVPPTHRVRSAARQTGGVSTLHRAVEKVRELLTPAVTTLFLMLFLLRIVRTLAIPFIPLFVQEIRGTVDGAPTIMGLIQASAGVATALAGVTLARLGDRLDRVSLMIRFLGIAIIAATPLFLLKNLVVFTAFYVVTTFFLGGIEPMLQSELAVKTEPGRRGLLFGLQTTTGNAGWALAPLIGSAVSITFGIPYVFLASTVIMGITEIVALTTARRVLSRRFAEED